MGDGHDRIVEWVEGKMKGEKIDMESGEMELRLEGV